MTPRPDPVDLEELRQLVRNLPVESRIEDGLRAGTLSVNNARAIGYLKSRLPALLDLLQEKGGSE